MISRHTIATVVLVSLCIFAIHKEQQIVSISCLIIAVLSYYRILSTRNIDKLIYAFNKTKIENERVELGRIGQDIIPIRRENSSPARSILVGMTPQHFDLLFALSQTDRWCLPANLKSTLQELRNRGLVEHSAPSLEDSTEVWLSNSGKKLMDLISQEGAATRITSSGTIEPSRPSG